MRRVGENQLQALSANQIVSLTAYLDHGPNCPYAKEKIHICVSICMSWWLTAQDSWVVKERYFA